MRFGVAGAACLLPCFASRSWSARQGPIATPRRSGCQTSWSAMTGTALLAVMSEPRKASEVHSARQTRSEQEESHSRCRGDGFGACRHVELVEQQLEVRLHRIRRNPEAGRDMLVAEAICQERENLPLASPEHWCARRIAIGHASQARSAARLTCFTCFT